MAFKRERWLAEVKCQYLFTQPLRQRENILPRARLQRWIATDELAMVFGFAPEIIFYSLGKE